MTDNLPQDKKLWLHLFDGDGWHALVYTMLRAVSKWHELRCLMINSSPASSPDPSSVADVQKLGELLHAFQLSTSARKSSNRDDHELLENVRSMIGLMDGLSKAHTFTEAERSPPAFRDSGVSINDSR